jgi:hypothetical protein
MGGLSFPEEALCMPKTIVVRRGPDNSPNQRAGHHAEQERAREREKQKYTHVVLPSE